MRRHGRRGDSPPMLYEAPLAAILAQSGEQDMNDLFGGGRPGAKASAPKITPAKAATPVAAFDAQASYSAKDIEVLEGLEPVRRRPGMYIGGTDDNALHHLAAEIIDNALTTLTPTPCRPPDVA